MTEFSHYFDTGVLVKIYHLEPGSPEAAKHIQKAGILPLPFLAEMELRNSLRVLEGRKQLSRDQLVKKIPGHPFPEKAFHPHAPCIEPLPERAGPDFSWVSQSSSPKALPL
ncbi:MAG: hypothetical protein ACLFUF_07295 [Opitutales bacterium]